MYTYVDDVPTPPIVTPAVTPAVKFATLTFLPNGKIASTSTSPSTVRIMTDVTMDLSNSTKMEGSFSVNSTSQDGRTAADMTSYKVNNDGTIEAIYADGTAEVMAQVVLAKFDNLQGLTASSNNQWVESSLSGKPHLGIAGSGGFGSIQGGSTEGSNVDLTTEMVRLIAAQRAFQSAAEVVKKQDETVQTINRIGG
jgi:flagellar hook protein FlgE